LRNGVILRGDAALGVAYAVENVLFHDAGGGVATHFAPECLQSAAFARYDQN